MLQYGKVCKICVWPERLTVKLQETIQTLSGLFQGC